MATYADVDAIIARWNGRQCDRDGFPAAQPYQCHDWAAQYSQEIGGPTYLPTPNTGGARDVYEQYDNLPTIKAFYERIANTPDFVPRKGDIMVWTATPGNIYGHIAVCDGEGDTNYFMSYDQNWNGVYRVTRVRHNYNYVLGVLRPKNLTNAPVGEPPMNDQQYKDAYMIVLQRPPEGPKDGRTGMQFIYDAQGELKAQRDAASAKYATKEKEAAANAADAAAAKAALAEAQKQVAQVTKQYQDALKAPVSQDQAVDKVAEIVTPSAGLLSKIIAAIKSRLGGLK